MTERIRDIIFVESTARNLRNFKKCRKAVQEAEHRPINMPEHVKADADEWPPSPEP